MRKIALVMMVLVIAMIFAGCSKEAPGAPETTASSTDMDADMQNINSLDIDTTELDSLEKDLDVQI